MSGQVLSSWMWGSSSRLTLVAGNQAFQQFSGQLAQVSLPTPAVCSFYLQAAITRRTNPATTVGSFTVNLLEGVGRVTVPRSITFAGQPSPGAPLEFTLPFAPVHALQVEVVGILGGAFNPGDELDIECFFVLSPLTSVAGDKKGIPLDFGMALPGEADGLDEAMHDEVEEEHPGTLEIMRQRLTEADQGEGVEDEGDEPELELSREQRRALVRERVQEHLTRRLGRKPSPLELSRALRKLREQLRAARQSEAP